MSWCNLKQLKDGSVDDWVPVDQAVNQVNSNGVNFSRFFNNFSIDIVLYAHDFTNQNNFEN